MTVDLKAIEAEVFAGIQSAMQTIADKIDDYEEMDDFQLVELYAEIERLNTRTSFATVVTEMFRLAGDDYDPPGDFVRAQVRRYDAITKLHPTNAYQRFRSIADRMEDKWTAVNAVLEDRKRRALDGGYAKAEKSPKSRAMREVMDRWEAAQRRASVYRTDAQFARDMMKDFGAVLTEGGIKNSISRWRKGKR